MYPVRSLVPDEPIVGAAAVHGVLSGWRRMLQGTGLVASTTATRMPAPLPDAMGSATLGDPQDE